MIFCIEGHPSIDRVEAPSWAAAEKEAEKLGAKVAGELVEAGEWKSATLAFGLTELKFAEDSGEAMSFKGYGAVFNNVDAGGDKILPGAFSETLAEHKAAGTMPSMLYQHGRMGGGPVMPVGKWTAMHEDSRGLWVEGKLFDHSLGKDLYVALKGGGIGGLSIGYRAKEIVRPAASAAERRQLKNLALFEVSLVNQPMNDLARFTAVKAADEIKTLRDFEAFLRDAGGFSNARAKAIASHGFKAIDADRDDGEGLAALADSIRRNLSILQS
jgi:uncharacterized protein